MTTNIVAFPKARTANINARLLSGPRGNIVSLDGWKQKTRAHRTANGVFFMTSVLSTTGDFA